MKIVYLSSSIIPSRSANSVHVMKMCQAFARSGHEVTLIAPDAQDEYEPGVVDEYAYYGVESCFEILKISRPNLIKKNYFYGVLAAMRARKLKPDLVYGRDPTATILAAFLGMRVMFELHSPFSKNTGMEALLFNRFSYHPRLERLVVITQALKAHYVESHPHLAHKIHVAPDGADQILESVEPIASLAEQTRFQVGYVGQLYSGKGMEIIESLARQCDWADFHVVGGMENDLNYWKKRCRDQANIIFHGYVPHSETQRYIESFDVVLLPNQAQVSTHGGGKADIGQWTSPLKLFEYMAARKTIISSDLPVLKEVLKHGRNALLCKADDPKTWASELRQLKNNSLLSEQLADNAYQDFMEFYSWDVRAKNLLGDFRFSN